MVGAELDLGIVGNLARRPSGLPSHAPSLAAILLEGAERRPVEPACPDLQECRPDLDEGGESALDDGLTPRQIVSFAGG